MNPLKRFVRLLFLRTTDAGKRGHLYAISLIRREVLESTGVCWANVEPDGRQHDTSISLSVSHRESERGESCQKEGNNAARAPPVTVRLTSTRSRRTRDVYGKCIRAETDTCIRARA